MMTEMEARLTKLEASLQQLIEMKVRDHAEMQRYLTEVHAILKQHELTLFGSDGRGGLTADLLLMKQAGKVAAWLMGATAVASISLVIQQFGKWVFVK